jgi:hypothetical protein
MLTDGRHAALLERSNPFASLFQEITEIAQAKLRGSSYFELRGVCCDFSGGVLTLRGRVPSHHLKQLAHANVSEVPGVLEIDNRVEVVPPRVSHDTDQRDRETSAAAQGSCQ